MNQSKKRHTIHRRSTPLYGVCVIARLGNGQLWASWAWGQEKNGAGDVIAFPLVFAELPDMPVLLRLLTHWQEVVASSTHWVWCGIVPVENSQPVIPTMVSNEWLEHG